MTPLSQLVSFDLFSRLDEDQLQCLAHQTRIHLEPDQVLLERGQDNHHLYVLLSGCLRVQLAPRPGIPLSILRPGQCLGEETLFTGGSSSMNIVADEASTLLKIPREVVLELIRQNPAWSQALLETLADRLHHRNETLHHYEHATTSDLLTGLRNRRWLQVQLDRALSRCQFSRHPLTLIMVDIDGLKRINDRLGHRAGDQILIAVTETLRYQLRPDAMLVRYSGGELMVVLPELGLDVGALVADRLRRAVEQLETSLPDGRPLPGVTISVGMAESIQGEQVAQLIARTEAALGQAKRRGGNQVEAALKRSVDPVMSSIG